MACASSVASSASISALCFLSSAILFVCTGASAAPRLARAAAQMMRRRRPMAELQQVDAGSPRKESSSDFLRARWSCTTKMTSKRLLLPRISVPRIVNQLGEAMTRLLSSRLESIAELRKGIGERAVQDPSFASRAGRPCALKPDTLSPQFAKLAAICGICASIGACRAHADIAHAAYSK